MRSRSASCLSGKVVEAHVEDTSDRRDEEEPRRADAPLFELAERVD